MELKGKRVMILGLARTGLEATRFLIRRGAEVWVSDCKTRTELKNEVQALSALPVRFFLAGEEKSWLEGVELLVSSPGVPQTNAILREAGRRGIPIWSEIELAFRFVRAPLVAITGTNGKSTTTTLIGELLKANGMRIFVGGNIGSPFIGFVSEDWDWGVLEVSSFQLEWIEQFRPKVAVLLNLTADHLDRYPSFASYCAVKEKLFSSQGPEDIAVLNKDDALVWAARERIRSKTISFGWQQAGQGVFAAEREVVWRGESGEEHFPLSRIKIHGVHNVENLMAAIAAAKWIGVPRAIIQNVIEAFPGLEHRLEFVREIKGIRFYNDSKGTNVGALLKSLGSFAGPIVLLAGGVDKGGSYRILEDAMKRKVRKLVLFGEAKEIIRKALGHLTETETVESLDSAVQLAYKSALPGDVVLLSPACSSFDMFRNYAERGNAFKALVRNL